MVEKDNLTREQRNYFRVTYPEQDPPILTVGKYIYSILDLSEKGIRFKLSNMPILMDDNATGKLTVDAGKWISIKGKIYLNPNHSFEYRLDSKEVIESIKETSKGHDQKFSIDYKRLLFERVKLDNNSLIFKARGKNIFKVFPSIEGTIKFPKTDSVKIAGKIIRFNPEESVLLLEVGVPYNKIVQEQIYLRNKYAGRD